MEPDSRVPHRRAHHQPVVSSPAADVQPAAPVHHPAEPAKKERSISLKIPRFSKTALLWLVITVVVVAAIAAAGFFYNRYHNAQKEIKKLSSASSPTQNETQQLINEVGKLTILPSGETPTVATVTDITKLKDQPFFVGAKNGDKILIYSKAKKAYLYRPSTNQLLQIAPVNLGNNQ